MTGSWVGTHKLAASVLESLFAEREGDFFKVSGPEIQPLMGEPGLDWIEIHPETMCYLYGQPCLIVDLLAGFCEGTPTVGLPVAKRRS